ncbi:Crp/Fnr family transcriptional regulator [Aquimarina sediminis]|uniref:Crp/Fnr family transcriptional regulator n=1 Tax=Aquimarina sediminis TaxID=2070536 RepID=UPI000CA016AB|nr:Crp/Fnr family transcriptional regulator [Aquimarina sediminis]
MKEQFYTHLSKFAKVDKDNIAEILSYFESRSLKKKEVIMHAGKKCKTNYFVLNGCLHMYYINDKGTEQTIQFGIENWWITDYLAFHQQGITDFYIQAVEKSNVLSIDYSKQQELFEKFPEVEKYFRNIYQIAYGSTLIRMKYMFNYSKEEIFFRFRDNFPEFVQRVPQYLIATYLGLTPEYLSEIKSKHIS